MFIKIYHRFAPTLIPKWLPWNEPPCPKKHPQTSLRIPSFGSDWIRSFVVPLALRDPWCGLIVTRSTLQPQWVGFSGMPGLPTALEGLEIFFHLTAGKWLIKLTGWWLNQPNPSEKICAVVKIGNHHFPQVYRGENKRKYLSCQHLVMGWVCWLVFLLGQNYWTSSIWHVFFCFKQFNCSSFLWRAGSRREMHHRFGVLTLTILTPPIETQKTGLQNRWQLDTPNKHPKDSLG